MKKKNGSQDERLPRCSSPVSILSIRDEPKENAKLLKTDVKRSFQGDIKAESTAVLLMCLADNGSAGYVATERVVGRIGSRSGSFVIQHGGAVEAGSVTDSFGYVVPGSGTGELQGLRGHCG
ncbi:DUF3224 domain-containing protein [Dictyobacter alpinus]|uniref:DUF3224 domain-containing protein n=1 Tax=Dictyobacter alpinus TaxID=2014873 RepID=UPI000F81B9DD|nr:DUF3224 domain-containing protein [Dictyobacter alpinus]